MTDYTDLARRLREHAEHHSVVAFMDGEQRQWMEDLKCAADLIEAMGQQEPTSGNWINADDVAVMAKQLDLAMNGPNAAERPALCDVISQAMAHFREQPAQPQEQREPQITHTDGCWTWGPRHHDCALREISRLQASEPTEAQIPDYLKLQIAGTAAAHDVLVERRRQIKAEGWSPEHDDEHANGGLALAAACYALSSAGIKGDDPAQLRFWPWDDDWWRPSDRRRDLVKAGALILAEIERLDRAALAAKEQPK